MAKELQIKIIFKQEKIKGKIIINDFKRDFLKLLNEYFKGFWNVVSFYQFETYFEAIKTELKENED